MKYIVYIVIFVIIAAIGFGVYYFFFMDEGSEGGLPTVTIGKIVPVLNMTVLDNPIYNSLKNYTTLPITVGTVGNPQPFNEIIFVAPPSTEEEVEAEATLAEPIEAEEAETLPEPIEAEAIIPPIE